MFEGIGAGGSGSHLEHSRTEGVVAVGGRRVLEAESDDSIRIIVRVRRRGGSTPRLNEVAVGVVGQVEGLGEGGGRGWRRRAEETERSV
jgi:hypothetical protein